MSEPFESSRSLTALEQDSTVIAVIEMSQSSWLVAAVIPGVERQPLKKLDADEEALLKLLHRWRNEANRAGREIKRIVVAYEAGRDGFWLARWLRTRDVEAYVIHPTSVAVSRDIGARRPIASIRNCCASSRQPLLGTKALTRWFASLGGSSAWASRRRTCWSMRSSRATCAIAEPSRATPASPARRTRAADAGASGVLRAPAAPASGAA